MQNKSTYNPQKHYRRSIRLKGYDYSQAGEYFITICVKHMACLYGHIADEEMHLNATGQMIDKWWQKIPEKFPDIELGVYQIMPNHFHAIAINTGPVRADPSVRPESPIQPEAPIENEKNEAEFNTPIINDFNADEITIEKLLFGAILISGEHEGSPLHRVVQWFKTMTTNEYIRNVKRNGWPRFDGKLWHRNYHEHIIRKDASFQRISNYIICNPANWKYDKFR